MASLRKLRFALCVLIAACSVAQLRVGVMPFGVAPRGNDTQTPGFPATLWYPTQSGEEQDFGVSRVRSGYRAVANATPAFNGQVPLIILNHGSGGSAESMAWIATHLARGGALVVAADHPQSAGGDPERASILQLWTQPDDTRHLLSEVLESSWGRHVDPQRVAVVGFSLGGMTALSLAGTRLKLERFADFCAQHDDGACRAFRSHLSLFDAAFLLRTNADMREPRIRAAVAIAPGFSESVTAESLERTDTPILVISGGSDQQLPPRTHLAPIQHKLTGKHAYYEIPDAQHFSFLPVCGPNAAAVLVETNEAFVCEEFGQRTRPEIHAEVLANIDRFLQANGIL